MKVVVSDIETEKLENPETLWLFGGVDARTGERYRFDVFRGEKERAEAEAWANGVDLWVGHNFISFDAIHINRLVKPRLIDPTKVIDTMIVSRLIEFDRPVPKGCKSGHSLEAHGIRLGVHKGQFNKFHEFSQEMVEYWESDLDVTLALFEDFKPWIYNPDWKKAMRVEHDIQIELERQKFYGFDFDSEKASTLLSSIKEKMKVLEDGFQEDFPPKLEVVKSVKYQINKDGSEGHHVKANKEKYPLTKVEDGDLICYDYVPFKPSSSKKRIEVLWEAGWKPFEKTKTHQQFGRKKVGQPYGKSVKRMSQEFYDKKKAELEFYGWTCSEDNLNTLPPTAPEGAKKLAQWLCLEGRRSSLVEWLGQVKSDGRIHGSVMSIGAWTHRCAHNGPNTANISSPFHDEPKTAVEEIKFQYDGDLRSCWRVPEGKFLLGTDASGIQLRLLAHYMKSQEYVDAILSGRSEDGTDIHNINRRALLFDHITRDMSKTFVYAFLLGAGTAKVASILRVNQKQAKEAVENFTTSIEGLSHLKKEVIPFVAKRGWFTGLDGRKVLVPNEHKTLAGFLQAGEAVVMKHWIVNWQRKAREEGLQHKMVGFVHDEAQVECNSEEEAIRLREIQMQTMVEVGEFLNVFCPLAAEGKIGKNWAQSH